MRAGPHVRRAALRFAAFGAMLSCTSGCGDDASTYPFPAAWRSLTETGVALVVEPDGSATLEGTPSKAPDCEDNPSAWSAGGARWEGLGANEFEVTPVSRPDRAVYVQAKTPFGSVDWSTIYVGLCGRGSDRGEWIELKGGPEPSP